MAEQIITKRCCKCKEIKPLSEFSKDQSSKDCYQPHCKICRKQYRQSEKGKASHKRYNQSKKGKACQKRYANSKKGKATVLAYTVRYPERIKARQVVNAAIKEDRLPRPDSLQCSCSKQAAHYHHHKGYEPKHWLDVIPVCFDCHYEARRTSI